MKNSSSKEIKPLSKYNKIKENEKENYNLTMFEVGDYIEIIKSDLPNCAGCKGKILDKNDYSVIIELLSPPLSKFCTYKRQGGTCSLFYQNYCRKLTNAEVFSALFGVRK